MRVSTAATRATRTRFLPWTAPGRRGGTSCRRRVPSRVRRLVRANSFVVNSYIVITWGTTKSRQQMRPRRQEAKVPISQGECCEKKETNAQFSKTHHAQAGENVSVVAFGWGPMYLKPNNTGRAMRIDRGSAAVFDAPRRQPMRSLLASDAAPALRVVEPFP